jgi:hypothetical protein
MCCPISHSLPVVKQNATPQVESAPRFKWIGKAVSWIRADENRSKLERLAVRCLVAVAAIFLSLTLIGLPLVYFVAEEWYRQRNMEAKLVQPPISAPSVERQEQLKKILAEKPLTEIREILGNETYEALPIIDIKDRRGLTDYIDFLKKSDLSSPAMRGIDCFNRPFIAFKAKNNETGEKFAQVIFQRYTKDESRWTFAGHDCRQGMFEDLGIIFGREHLERLARVLKGEDNKFVLLA